MDKQLCNCDLYIGIYTSTYRIDQVQTTATEMASTSDRQKKLRRLAILRHSVPRCSASVPWRLQVHAA